MWLGQLSLLRLCVALQKRFLFRPRPYMVARALSCTGARPRSGADASGEKVGAELKPIIVSVLSPQRRPPHAARG